MEIFHHRFDLSELNIRREDIERLMGYDHGLLPDPFPGMIGEVWGELGEHCSPQGGFALLEGPEINLETNRIRVGGQTFRTDRTVTRMLRKAESIAAFICTAGRGLEEWTREINGSEDPVRGFVIDAFGSVTADAVAEKLQSIIEEKARLDGKSITNRYSPGYCDWPVGDQQDLFSFFPEKFCGITLSATSLMHPIKSISGFVGIGTEVRFHPYPCDACRDEHCIYRKIKTYPFR
jgi:hypothetical protein